MAFLGYLLLILVVFVFLLGIDYKLGRRYHLSSLSRKNYPMRQSEIRVFTDGPSLFREYFHDIEQARLHVHVLFYIVKDDSFGQQFLELLKKKAREGVEVRLLVDWAGSFSVPKKLIKEVKQAGVQVAHSHVPWIPYAFYRSQVRNHRKITCIDGKIGYIGGYNVGKEYIGEDPKLSPWRDYHMRIVGEGVHDLQREFLLDWEEETREKLVTNSNYFPDAKAGPIRHQIIPSEGFYLEETFSGMLRSAEKSITIGSPYFIPSKRLLGDLLHALERGVEVTVIVPKIADHAFVQEASYRYHRQILAKGARVFQYTKGFYHAKILIIDDRICDSGTANFDTRSVFLNHEINCYMYDEKLIAYMKEIVARDIQDSEPLFFDDLDQLGWTTKFKEWLVRPFAYFL